MDGKGTWEDYELTRDGRTVYVNLAYEWTFEGEDTDGAGAVYPADFTIGTLRATCANCPAAMDLTGEELATIERELREVLVEEREAKLASEAEERWADD